MTVTNTTPALRNAMVMNKTEARIIAAVCGEYGIRTEELTRRRRRGPVVLARQMAAYMLYTFAECTYARTGEILERSAGTVYHHVEAVSEGLDIDRRLRERHDNIVRALNRRRN